MIPLSFWVFEKKWPVGLRKLFVKSMVNGLQVVECIAPEKAFIGTVLISMAKITFFFFASTWVA